MLCAQKKGRLEIFVSIPRDNHRSPCFEELVRVVLAKKIGAGGSCPLVLEFLRRTGNSNAEYWESSVLERLERDTWAWRMIRDPDTESRMKLKALQKQWIVHASIRIM